MQIHLHTQSDIARMKYLAFAVQPGSHSVASVKYQYVRKFELKLILVHVLIEVCLALLYLIFIDKYGLTH
jgi:hypothetical protein